MYSIMSSAYKDSLTSFPVWILFTSFSSLISVSRTSKAMLNKSGESEHLCLVLDFRGNAFSFSLLSMILTIGLSYMAFIMLSYIPSMPTSWRVFIVNRCWILSKAFSASIEMIVCFLLFNLLMWCITLIDLQILKNPCIPGMIPLDHGVKSF